MASARLTRRAITVYERVALETPSYKAAVSGGVLTIKGNLPAVQFAAFGFWNWLIFYGKSLNANTQVDITGLDSQVINKTLSYKVDAPTQAYLVIHQADDVLNNSVFFSHQYPIPWVGPAYVYTELITLSP